MLESRKLIEQLVALYGPPGQEKAVREWLAEQLSRMGYESEIDPKGNLVVHISGSAARPHVLVTAHMDEIALIITKIDEDGKIHVAPLGGVYTWKWGEGAVTILTRNGPVPAILSFGSIHTNSSESVVERARKVPIPWEDAYLFSGKSTDELDSAGIRPGLRVVMALSRRDILELGDFIGSYFLDDRADLVTWLLALDMLKGEGTIGVGKVTFAATASEEVGGEGACYLLRNRPSDICVALEIGPKTVDADFEIDAQPTIWVRDAYSSMEAVDGDILTDCCEKLGLKPHWQFLTRGGSDASCAAAKGLTARPVTLGLPCENSHGYEIIHKDSMAQLARLLVAFLKAVV